MAQFALIAATGLKVASAIQQGRVANAMGKAQRAAKEREAEQLDQNAVQTVAAAQRKAMEEKRRGDLVASRALAIAAAGGGASDKSVVNIISDLKGEGSYRAMLAMYEGEDRARLMREQGKLTRFEGEQLFEAGKAKKRAANVMALGETVSGAASMYTKYNTADTSGFDLFGSSTYQRGSYDQLET